MSELAGIYTTAFRSRQIRFWKLKEAARPTWLEGTAPQATVSGFQDAETFPTSVAATVELIYVTAMWMQRGTLSAEWQAMLQSVLQTVGRLNCKASCRNSMHSSPVSYFQFVVNPIL